MPGGVMTDHEAKSKIRWDEAAVRNVYPDVCLVTRTREEISLIFGTKPITQQAGPGEAIQLTDRIMLNASIAKRLATALDLFIKDYESKYGTLKKASPLPTETERKDKSAELFCLVKELGAEIGLEHSFKFLEKTLLGNRFLLGVSKNEIERNAQARIVHICKRLDMPEPLLETFRQCLVDANYIHFGFEESPTTCLYKVYLEFWEGIREEIQRGKDRSRPFLLHLGFKWDAFDNKRKTVTRYTWRPWISVTDIIARLGAILDPGVHGLAFDIARNVLNLAAARIPPQDILFLEVAEDDNPRNSFDLNVYRANLQVGELYPLLSKLGQQYKIPSSEFHRLYDRIKTQRFGHLSGGIGREGKDFCTVYYGVEPVYGDRLRLAHPAGDSLIAPVKLAPARPTVCAQPVEKTDEHAASLLEMVKNLKVPFGFKRAFKIMEKTFLPDRFLIGVRSREMTPEQEGAVLGICRNIGMPEEYLESFRNDFPRANVTLFGYERNPPQRYYKVYLEFNGRVQETVGQNADPDRPFRMFAGFKWDGTDNSQKVVTHYTFFPSLILRDMASRAAELLCRKEGEIPYRIVEGILDLAAQRAGPKEFLFFEPEEAAAESGSFSINVYKAGLRMAEIYPLLQEMLRHYSVEAALFSKVYERVKTRCLGHVGGGIDREGRDFLTLYF